MKTLSLFICLQVLVTFALAQGSSCSNAIPLTLDGVIRNYNLSTTLGDCITCGYSGNNGRVTFFQFTTDNVPQCVAINLSTSTTASAELTLYSSCGGSPTTLNPHTLCMNTGNGIWAQDLFSNLLANTTYYLRVRTENNFAGTLNIAASYNTPVNDNCFGATSISSIPYADNNACHTPGPGIPATDLCAVTLENTAWYTYQIQSNGSTTITIENIACNNGSTNSNTGFQIGFYRGNCNGLVPVSCSSGTSGVVTATAMAMLAGERIYVAIDGYSGSNCTYTVRASNSVPLSVTLKSFTGIAKGSSNLLRWTSLQEFNNLYYEVERSINGRTFQSIGRINGIGNSDSETEYSFEDKFPVEEAFYRLKDVDIDQKVSYSKIIELKRTAKPKLRLAVQNPVQAEVNLFVTTNVEAKAELLITDILGNIVLKDRFYLREGLNHFRNNTERLAQGKYIVSIVSNNIVATSSFIKSVSRQIYK